MRERIALKVQRQRYAPEARDEISVHMRLREAGAICPEIVRLREAFQFQGHICLAFDRHGRNLADLLERGPMPPRRARRGARQILTALEHLQRAGYAHTDIKPDNILYRWRTGEVRLADLGDAERRLRQGTLYGTRGYMPPEMILGAPLGPSIDLWSFGCTLFEMLTGRYLFDPRAAAAKKYHEFSAPERALPVAASELEDQAAEEAEQLPRGTIVAKKYRLEQPLGRGRFGTVWLATILNGVSLDCSSEILRSEKKISRPRQSWREQQARAWRQKKGADDLVDLTLHYEQLLLITALCGGFPPGMIQSARYRKSYFEVDGALRFRPILREASLRERLRRASSLRGEDLTLVTDLLRRCLTIDPEERITAAEALTHPWLRPA